MLRRASACATRCWTPRGSSRFVPGGWAGVRMGAVAHAVGVSRRTARRVRDQGRPGPGAGPARDRTLPHRRRRHAACLRRPARGRSPRSRLVHAARQRRRPAAADDPEERGRQRGGGTAAPHHDSRPATPPPRHARPQHLGVLGRPWLGPPAGRRGRRQPRPSRDQPRRPAPGSSCGGRRAPRQARDQDAENGRLKLNQPN